MYTATRHSRARAPRRAAEAHQERAGVHGESLWAVLVRASGPGKGEGGVRRWIGTGRSGGWIVRPECQRPAQPKQKARAYS